MTKGNIFEITKRMDKNTCRFFGCNQTEGLTSHHLITRGQGGPDTEWNLITLCVKHHQMVHSGKTSSLHILETLKRKRDFRWWEAYKQLLANDEFTKIRKKR